MDFLWFCLIGLCAGWLAGMLTKGGGFGLVGNLIVGVIGAILGGAIFKAIGLQNTNLLGSLVMATVGAVVLLLLLSVFARRSK
ncbi:MAG: GlsB/YeaQ/YmgE family stress response membrane protein [Phycisphaeraceae bacterium]|nr:GlsB/YeaQ/YmgE family stress response membrane protein [Phycisphaeraceae bacterium]MCW5753565.1 GlsB/YeaQ/YmgE family stress response membrane protein [Phycisphaeraceae bacterium]